MLWRFVFSSSLSGLFLSACTANSTLNPDSYFLAERQADRHQYDSATKIWETLSKEGDCDATWQLGVVHFMGYGTRQNSALGIELWSDAAARGQPRAQIALADIYFRNPNTWIVCSDQCGGIPADPVAAYRWYLIAKRNISSKTDEEYLSRAIPHARASLPTKQQRDVELEASQWAPRPVDCKPRKVM